MNDKRIKNTIFNYYNFLQLKGYEVVGVFLFGSQNYGLASEDSDIDAKAMVVPTLKNIYNNDKPANEHISLDDGSTIVVKDIRLYVNEFKKQGLSTLETLFTKYCYINPKYEDVWKIFKENAEKICRYDPHQCVRAFVGIISNQFEFLKQSINYASAEDLQNGENKIRYKSLCSMEFHRQMMLRYIAEEKFKQILNLDNLDYLRKIKFECDMNAEEALEHAQAILDSALETREKYRQESIECYEVSCVFEQAVQLAINKSFLRM
jgi:predicted nucleotidyltransferase